MAVVKENLQADVTRLPPGGCPRRDTRQELARAVTDLLLSAAPSKTLRHFQKLIGKRRRCFAKISQKGSVC